MTIDEAKNKLNHPRFGDEEAIRALKYLEEVMEIVDVVKSKENPRNWDMCICGGCAGYAYNKWLAGKFLTHLDILENRDFHSLHDAERVLRGEVEL